VSNTPKFGCDGYFPQSFCGMGDGTGLGFTHLDNLTLTQVMAFAWNLESFTISTVGTATNGTSSVNAANTLTVDGSGPSATAYDRGGGSGMWTPGAAVNTAWASWPANRIPMERVCAPALVSGLLGNIYALQGNYSGLPLETFFSLFFYVGPDPSNAGKFRIYYGFNFAVTGRASPSNDVQISFSEQDFGGSVNSGTVTIGGLTFNWYAYVTGTGSPTIGTTPALSGSSSDYTYV